MTSPQRDPAFLEALGRAIKVLRTERGLERAELAEGAGVSYPYLAEIENGKKQASSRALMAIAAALGIGMTELMATAEGLQAHGLRLPVHDAPGTEVRMMTMSEPGRRWFRSEEAPPRPRRRGDTPARAMMLRDLHEVLEQLSDEDLAHVLTLARRLTR